MDGWMELIHPPSSHTRRKVSTSQIIMISDFQNGRTYSQPCNASVHLKGYEYKIKFL